MGSISAGEAALAALEVAPRGLLFRALMKGEAEQVDGGGWRLRNGKLSATLRPGQQQTYKPIVVTPKPTVAAFYAKTAKKAAGLIAIISDYLVKSKGFDGDGLVELRGGAAETIATVTLERLGCLAGWWADEVPGWRWRTC